MMTKADNKTRKILAVLYMHVFPVLLFLSLEIQNMPARGGYPRVIGNPPALAVSCLLIYLVLGAVFMATGRLFLSGVSVSLVLLIFYAVSFYRRILSGTVLLPSDLNFTKEIDSISVFAELTFDWRIAVSVLCVAVLNVTLFFVARSARPSGKTRAAMLPVSLAVILLLFFTSYSRENILSVFNVSLLAREEANGLYEEMGVVMGFYSAGFAAEADAPPGYGRRYMENIAAKAARLAGDQDASGDVRPNVVIVMSESFFDPDKLPNVSYSQDPAPNLHSLADTVTGGKIVSPVFGGLTCNVEYELLTGNSMKYAGYGDIPYYKPDIYIDGAAGRSLPELFRQNGYTTIAMHTNVSTFYDRNQHYPKLGFDVFVGGEDMPEAKYKGAASGNGIISDEYFTDKLIELLESAEEPVFLFGITMQNHMPYPYDKYESTTVKVSSGLMDEEQTASLESCMEGIYDADAQLGRLYDYVMASDEPILLIFFGDHLPIITQNTGVYSDLGLISAEEIMDLPLEECYEMYTTPYAVFSNCVELPGSWGDISPYFLGALIADAAGVEKNLHYAFLLRAYESFQAMNDRLFAADGRLYNEPSGEGGELAGMLRALQYDAQFGGDYAGAVMSELSGESVPAFLEQTQIPQ